MGVWGTLEDPPLQDEGGYRTCGCQGGSGGSSGASSHQLNGCDPQTPWEQLLLLPPDLRGYLMHGRGPTHSFLRHMWHCWCPRVCFSVCRRQAPYVWTRPLPAEMMNVRSFVWVWSSGRDVMYRCDCHQCHRLWVRAEGNSPAQRCKSGEVITSLPLCDTHKHSDDPCSCPTRNLLCIKSVPSSLKSFKPVFCTAL